MRDDGDARSSKNGNLFYLEFLYLFRGNDEYSVILLPFFDARKERKEKTLYVI